MTEDELPDKLKPATKIASSNPSGVGFTLYYSPHSFDIIGRQANDARFILVRQEDGRELFINTRSITTIRPYTSNS